MIVCVCNNVSERKIRKAVDSGITRMSELRSELEVGTCCGKCHSCAKSVLREYLTDAQPVSVQQPVLFQLNAMAT